MKTKIAILILACSLSSIAQKRKLVWSEEFNDKTLNEKVWNFELGDGCPNICGWGNNEKQLYTRDNHELRDGKLVINVTKKDGKFYSTRITTASKKEFKYGRMEARAKVPTAVGTWPAFWMLGSNIKQVGWPKCGEIDILEYVGRAPGEVFTSLHTQSSHGNTINTKISKISGIDQGFHEYAIEWNEESIAFFVDGNHVYTYNPAVKNEDTWPYNQPFYFILNVAVGGNFGGPAIDEAAFPQTFEIDYIRVYQ
jgi:beta-glucanase (GH16 family)